MLRKILMLAIAIGYAMPYFSQIGHGTIKGTIVNDDKYEDAIPFANVALYKGSKLILGATTDFDGNYTLKPITPGIYTVQVSFTGYQTKKISDVNVSADQITFLDLKLTQGILLPPIDVPYIPPIIKPDGKIGKELTAKEIEALPARGPADIIRTVGNGIFGRDNGSGQLFSRGERNNSTAIYVNGIKQTSIPILPKDAIEEMSVETGGISAQYGDVKGSVTNITTKGGFEEYSGSIGFLSSGFKTGKTRSVGLDKFGFNLLEFSLSGPLKAKRDEKGRIKESIIDFLVSGELRSSIDSRPSATKLWKPKAEVESLIRENPYVFDPVSNSVIKRAELLTANDFEEIDFRLNDEDRTVVLNGKIDVRPGKLSTFSIGGNYSYVRGNNYNRAFSLYNYDNNSQSITTEYNVFGRYTQRFENDTTDRGENTLVQNVFFTIQGDFSRRSTITQDPRHQNDFFRYGYLGQFIANTSLGYSATDLNSAIVLDGQEYRGRFLNTFDAPISYDFIPSNINPVLANYTSNFYSFFPQGDSRYSTREQVEGNGGIVNGGAVDGSIYNMWSAAGTVSNGYSKAENDQIRLSGRGSADIGDHAIMLGFEYEQRIQRFYSLNPRDLWDLGRLLVNSHIQQIDSTAYAVTYDNPNPIDPTITFERRYGGDDQRSYFAYNMRRALGLNPQGTDFIDFDSYDISLYNMSYFSADQLISPANNINLLYSGYDYKGKKLNTSPSLDDFFNETNELGFKTRPVPAYQPVYIAGFLEDKFTIDDLIFRVGLRLDRFDANQPVLKDNFSFFPTRDVAYAKTQGLGELPSNIKDNFIVYVDDIENPAVRGIVGYRDPKTDVFYNAVGGVLNDPTVLQSGSSISPWLVDPDKLSTTLDMGTESFEDYEPQYNLMPRISFSFPISDEANFFANYDILTQRPSAENRLEPIDIIYIASHNRIINNPNLKPTKTISYEVGFKQKLSENSALTLSSFYKEQRDEIQIRKLIGAYPEDYLTFDNIDFGTVKGFILNYEMRRTKNIYFRLNYTIQFAEGTGSGSTSSINLANSDQPNLRTIFPYTYDQRHQIVSTIDYRFFDGMNYTGPTIKNKRILENTGLNINFFAGSGTPYTSRTFPGSNELLSGSASFQPVEGDISGSRLPWTYRVDLGLDKIVKIKWSDKNSKSSQLRVYLQVLNAFNRKNIQSVYAFTGNANDDGFLSSPLFQDQIRQQISEQSYRDQYGLRLQNPFNYELPRRIRLGAQLNF